MKKLFIIAVLVSVFTVCQQGNAKYAKGSLFVSIAPQKYFVTKIAGELFDVSVLVTPGASPHTYEPKPSQMVRLSESVIWFTTGVEFEDAWVPRITSACPNLKIIPADSGITKIEMVAAEEAQDEHADGDHDHEQATEPDSHDGHHHEGLDPHVWLSPELVRMQASTIARALSSIDPAHAAVYAENLVKFLEEIDSLQSEIKELITNSGANRFMVFHPSWGYFADEFGLRQVSIEVEGKEPGPRELGSILSLARREKIKTVFVQPQLSARAANTTAAEIGGTTAIADPLAANWAENLRAFAHALSAR